MLLFTYSIFLLLFSSRIVIHCIISLVSVSNLNILQFIFFFIHSSFLLPLYSTKNLLISMTLIFFSSVISPLYPLVPLFALSLSLIINYNYMTMILIPVLFYRITVFLFVILNLILHFNLILFQYLFNQEYRNQDQYQ